jgi:hypothetical protein
LPGELGDAKRSDPRDPFFYFVERNFSAGRRSQSCLKNEQHSTKKHLPLNRGASLTGAHSVAGRGVALG